MTKTKFILLFLIIIGIASFLRLYQLGALPNSYTPDEVAQGYTAYSILKTGQDEWGNHDLFNLRSFGDYKPPLQTFLMIPAIKLFGLTPFAIRLPNALFGILAVIFTIIFSYQIFDNYNIALLSGLIIALSPWHVPTSRIALEATLAVCLITVASVLWFSKKLWLNYSASFIFIINLFTYHSSKIFAPFYVYFSALFLKNLIVSFSTSFLFCSFYQYFLVFHL